jgi:hypothetical protein
MITAAMTSLKTAMDIAKILKEATTTLEQAEVKFKLADLMSALADAKICVAEAKNALADRDAEISRLNDAFARKHDLVFIGDAYYEKNEYGKATGTPYCPHCWEVLHRLVHMLDLSMRNDVRLCPACKAETFNSEHIAGVKP